MTTLSKEDVVLLMEKSKFRSWIRGEGPSNEGFFMQFTTLARADLVAENERLLAANRDCIEHFNAAMEDLTATRTALAAAEAREIKLRGACELGVRVFGEGEAAQAIGVQKMRDALAQPRDDSALREMIAGVYEECAKVCDVYPGAEPWEILGGSEGIALCTTLAAAIRALAEKARHGG